MTKSSSDSETLTPAERYARSRQSREFPLVASFIATREFDLDAFQLAAINILERGQSVLVAAPTGAGKTVVAEYAVYKTMQTHSAKLFYTTPIKALSNQKYNELVAQYGAEAIGLLTGDTSVNPSAQIVVMTTEVLRNMIYAQSTLLDSLQYVVMDEVHYLADKFRGPVWEEVILHLPQHIKLVSLSATVSNAEEFGEWLQVVRGETGIVVSEDRPVPLDQHALVGRELVELFDPVHKASSAIRVNPELMRLAAAASRQGHYRNANRSRSSRGNRGRAHVAPVSGSARAERAEVVELLASQNLLPAIFFIFSRIGCDQSVQQLKRARVNLTSADEKLEIRHLVDDLCSHIPEEDLGVLGFWEWADSLERGFASHHAGLIPAFKEVVELLFQKKLVKVIFATETLALGINMPARSVVLEKLEKFNGEQRLPLTAGEYTQLTGRAGRRGIDVEGHSVVQWHQSMDPQIVANLASRRTYPLNSSFRPTYNMAVNLVERFGQEHTREILERSFAQFQADRAVVSLAEKARSQNAALDGYAESMECHLGNFVEYAEIRRNLTDMERAPSPSSRSSRDQRLEAVAQLRKQMKSHPCHLCPEREQHARWAERWWRLKRDTDKISREIAKRTGAIARAFDDLCSILTQLNYLAPVATSDQLQMTTTGRTLARIYGDRDLLVAECLARNSWQKLDVPSLAALVTALVFEPRREEFVISEQQLPRGEFIRALRETQEIWSELDDLEQKHNLAGTQPLALGLCKAVYRWSQGASLTETLQEADLPAGDFIRWCKQAADLLDQLSLVAEGQLGVTARRALDTIRRGIVVLDSAAA